MCASRKRYMISLIFRLVLTKKGVDEDFAQDLNALDKTLVLATQGPLQSSIFGTTIKVAAWHTKPSWFVIAANDRAIAPEQEKMTAKRMEAKTLTLERAAMWRCWPS